MRIRRTASEFVFDCFNHVFMVFWAVIALYPLLYVLFASLSDAGRLARHRGLILYPFGIHFDAYRRAFQNPLIVSGYKNTIIVVVLGTLLNLLMTALGAYFLSRKNVLWKTPVMVMLVITMYFGGGLIPGFLVVRALGMVGSLAALIIPSAVSAFNIIVMRTAFQSIPDSLEDAAVIDGAGHISILFRVILPISKAILAVMALWYGVDRWNAWYSAAIYLSKKEMWPIQLVLRDVLIQNTHGKSLDQMVADVNTAESAQIAETIKYALIIIATVPILCIYPFFQKHFVKGVMIGSLKG